MKKKIKPMSKGIYGGDSNGANPPEWTLKDTICSQLRAAGYHCEMGRLGDKSGSWILIYKNENSPSTPKLGKRLAIEIGFNDKGSIIDHIRMFEENFSITSSGTSGIF